MRIKATRILLVLPGIVGLLIVALLARNSLFLGVNHPQVDGEQSEGSVRQLASVPASATSAVGD